MSLKQLGNLQRILFLNEFISEVIIHSAEDERLKRVIEAEKLKRKFKLEEKEEEIKLPKVDDTYEKSPYLPSPRIIQRRTVAKPRPIKRQPVMRKPPQKIPPARPPVPAQQIPPMQPVEIEDSSLQKLDTLIKDPSVQIIECPGPGKNILVKARNRVSSTKIVMGEEEIKKVIDFFSKEAKIPVAAGILKAVVGSLLISAVESDYVGSRFIIHKRSPYDLIRN